MGQGEMSWGIQLLRVVRPWVAVVGLPVALERQSGRTLGDRGERAAARYLKRRGFTIVATSSRDRIGELDLVAVERGTVVFIEVKTRVSTRTGDPLEAVDREKQRRLARVAVSFLRRHDLLETPARFDVVGVLWPPWARRPGIRHIRHAFELPGDWPSLF